MCKQFFKHLNAFYSLCCGLCLKNMQNNCVQICVFLCVVYLLFILLTFFLIILIILSNNINRIMTKSFSLFRLHKQNKLTKKKPFVIIPISVCVYKQIGRRNEHAIDLMNFYLMKILLKQARTILNGIHFIF